MAIKPKQPCDRGCEKRTSECKLTCEKWADYELEYKKYDDAKYKEVQEVEMLQDATRASYKRWHIKNR